MTWGKSMLLKTLVTWCVISLTTPTLAETLQDQINQALDDSTPSKDCEIFVKDDTCYCYKKEEVKRLAQAILELKQCEIALEKKQLLIDERLLRFPDAPGPSWWQEPYMIGGAVTLSFTLGVIMAFAMQN